MVCGRKGITQFHLPPTHEPYQWIHCTPLNSEKCQGLAASRIFKIRPLVVEILHIVGWDILFWATLYKHWQAPHYWQRKFSPIFEPTQPSHDPLWLKMLLLPLWPWPLTLGTLNTVTKLHINPSTNFEWLMIMFLYYDNIYSTNISRW